MESILSAIRNLNDSQKYRHDAYFVSDDSPVRFVTGELYKDKMIYFIENESGLELVINDNCHMCGYKVIDECKFTLFLLRWA
jgi:hypothetical protein